MLRTYETFAIRFPRGSVWSGYETAAEAEAIVARAGEGEIVRSTFTVEVDPRFARLYRPGIA